MSKTKKSSARSAKKVSIQPLGDRVLVKPVDWEDEKSPAGIIIPDTAAKEKPQRGKVVAVGGGKRNESGDVVPVNVRVGDAVIFSKYGYDEVEIDDEEYYMVSETNILAVVK